MGASDFGHIQFGNWVIGATRQDEGQRCGTGLEQRLGRSHRFRWCATVPRGTAMY